ncbi:ATP-grasp domain-containing protein [Trinickia caryophylli]|nr:ATP-grasp domain-containing protein [Trinickia caryophylli]PMS11034.1 ATP-grasp domain-containing protein [Trinickia caryophylli]TRX14491.1 ATP-grasp domain-containing protein [Trinickia caryophylli]WQE14330.1 ATP-grasp domain-containing protein [Trinickia caryophylli]
MKRNALILGARAPAALDHARRFAHQGWNVAIADSIPCLISGASHAVGTALRIASPRHAPAQFVADLSRACVDLAIDLIVPTCEEVFFVSRYRHLLPREVRVLADGFDKLRDIHSKWCFLSLARDCGAHVPESALVGSIEQARQWAGTKPIVLKPEFSRFGVHVRLYRDGIPHDAPALAPLGNWVAQAYVQGIEFCSYSVADKGRLVAHSLYRPSWRMHRSSSFYFEPASIDAVREFVTRFARRIDFTGQLSFDWIQHPTGEVSVLECNPRATSGCHLFSLDDPLPAALEGTLGVCVEPVSPSPRMVGAVMLSAGLIDAVRRRDVRRWMRDYRRATDVIAVAGDRRPLGGAVLDLASYARLALAQRCNMREAATQDIEWDGQALPDL